MSGGDYEDMANVLGEEAPAKVSAASKLSRASGRPSGSKSGGVASESGQQKPAVEGNEQYDDLFDMHERSAKEKAAGGDQRVLVRVDDDETVGLDDDESSRRARKCPNCKKLVTPQEFTANMCSDCGVAITEMKEWRRRLTRARAICLGWIGVGVAALFVLIVTAAYLSLWHESVDVWPHDDALNETYVIDCNAYEIGNWSGTTEGECDKDKGESVNERKRHLLVHGCMCPPAIENSPVACCSKGSRTADGLSCVLLSDEPMTFEHANKGCPDRSWHVATPTAAAADSHRIALKASGGAVADDQELWLGASETNNKWTLPSPIGSHLMPLRFVNWARGHPPERQTDGKRCALLSTQDFLWRVAENCSLEKEFVCQKSITLSGQ